MPQRLRGRDVSQDWVNTWQCFAARQRERLNPPHPTTRLGAILLFPGRGKAETYGMAAPFAQPFLQQLLLRKRRRCYDRRMMTLAIDRARSLGGGRQAGAPRICCSVNDILSAGREKEKMA
jgi:hypothetical protein